MAISQNLDWQSKWPILPPGSCHKTVGNGGKTGHNLLGSDQTTGVVISKVVDSRATFPNILPLNLLYHSSTFKSKSQLGENWFFLLMTLASCPAVVLLQIALHCFELIEQYPQKSRLQSTLLVLWALGPIEVNFKWVALPRRDVYFSPQKYRCLFVTRPRNDQ